MTRTTWTTPRGERRESAVATLQSSDRAEYELSLLSPPS